MILMEYLEFEEVGSSYDVVFGKISQLVHYVSICKACDQIVLPFLIHVPQQNTNGYLLRTQIKELRHVALWFCALPQRWCAWLYTSLTFQTSSVNATLGYFYHLDL